MVEHKKIYAGWIALALFFSVLALMLTLVSSNFGYNHKLSDMPIFALVCGLMAAGLAYQVVPYLVRSTKSLDINHVRARWGLTGFVVAIGFVVRVAMFWSEPVLEDDYQRYLWDGGLVANGYNPYAVAPETASYASPDTSLGRLADEAGLVLERINHQHLRTIYPPVAQAAFAFAYIVDPWNLTAWRLVCVLGECVTLILLLVLLSAVGRSPLWCAVYWWNPLVIKELLNSAHMEAVLLPLLLGALLLAVRQRHLMATVMLGLAAGTKLWPLLLAPLILRPLLARPARLLAALVLLGGLMVLWLVPVALAGIDQSSGFVAYAQKWKTNSALFPVLEMGMDWLLAFIGVQALSGGLMTRLALFGLLAGFTIFLSRAPLHDAQDLLMRVGVVVGALVLLSPAQFPWYAVWVAPFLCFLPSRGLTIMMMTISLYYLAFYFFAQGMTKAMHPSYVWFVWLPVWALLAVDVWRYWHAPLAFRPHRAA